MMPKMQSAAKLRAQFNGDKPSGPSMKEKLLAQQHKRAHAVIEWLRENFDGETIVLPLPLNILNTHIHPIVLNSLKGSYGNQCKALSQCGLMPKPPATPPALWRVSITFYGAAKTDIDNARAMAGKWPHDWLKGRWMIDDAPEYFQIVEFVPLIDRKTPRIEFRTVTPDAL